MSLPAPPSPSSLEEAIQTRNFDAVVVVGDDAIVPLLYTWRRRDPIQKLWAYQAIMRLSDRAETPLIRALHHTDPLIRSATARFLAYNGGQRAIEPLIRALDDQDSTTRVNAAIALGRIGDERALEPLLRVLHDRDRNVAHHGGQALGGISYRYPAATLNIARDTTCDEKTRSYILRTLGYRTDDAAFKEERFTTLIAVLSDENESPAIREGAAAGLGAFSNNCVISPLVAALADNDGDVRASAARALGENALRAKGENDIRPVDPLIGVLIADNYPKARWMAALALRFFYDDRALPALLPLRNIPATSIDEKRIKEAAGFVIRYLRHMARRRAISMDTAQRDIYVP